MRNGVASISPSRRTNSALSRVGRRSAYTAIAAIHWSFSTAARSRVGLPGRGDGGRSVRNGHAGRLAGPAEPGGGVAQVDPHPVDRRFLQPAPQPAGQSAGAAHGVDRRVGGQRLHRARRARRGRTPPTRSPSATSPTALAVTTSTYSSPSVRRRMCCSNRSRPARMRALPGTSTLRTAPRTVGSRSSIGAPRRRRPVPGASPATTARPGCVPCRAARATGRSAGRRPWRRRSRDRPARRW